MKLSKGHMVLLGQAAVAFAALGMTTAGVAALLGRGEQRRQVLEVVDQYASEVARAADPKPDQAKPGNDGGAATKPGPSKGGGPESRPGKADRGSANPGPGGPARGESPKAKSPQDQQVERITKRHVFSLTPPKQKFSGKLIGVLGNQAFFAGANEGVGVDGMHNGAKVVAIGPDWAEVEFEGAKQKLQVFAPGGEGGPPSPSGPPPGGPPMPPPAMGPAGPPPPTPVRAKGPSREMPPGFKLTPEMIEQFKKLPPDKQQEAMQELPEDMREQLKKAL